MVLILWCFLFFAHLHGSHYNTVNPRLSDATLIHNSTVLMQRLFEGGTYSRAVLIRGRRLFEGGNFRGRRYLFEGSAYLRAALFRGQALLI